MVNDPAARGQIEIDVAVTAAERADRRRLLALGEVKWGETIGPGHLDRLRRARELLTRRGLDTASTRLLLFSGAGFSEALRTMAQSDPQLLLIGLGQLYPDLA